MTDTYAVKYYDADTKQTYELEGEAKSPHAACRLAFKELIKQGKIKRQPKTNLEFKSSFHNTWVTRV